MALAACRCVDLVQMLLALGKKVVPQVSHSSLNAKILKIQKLLSRNIPDTLDIALHLSGDMRSVQADQTQVRQILMNLWANARAVMPEEGTLTIETANIDLDERAIARRTQGLSLGVMYCLLFQTRARG